ncbi:MAG: type II toxin-antitoxin system prevent-host-death family antitoxin [Acidimicrobiales bacterium]
MDVPVTELRAHLAEWLEKAEAGEEVIITDHGVPVARLVGVDSLPVLRRLTREGIISRPTQSVKIKAQGRKRPSASSSLADLVSEQRR